MAITKRFYERAQLASHLLTIGHYHPTIDDAYNTGGSVEKRRVFFRLYYKFLDLQKEGKIAIDHMGIVTKNIDFFTFACNFVVIKTGEFKCFYATPWNNVIFNPCKSWEDFKKDQKAKGL